VRYFLIQPIDVEHSVGTIRQIFETESEGRLWFAENETNPDFEGWYVVPESEIGKLN